MRSITESVLDLKKPAVVMMVALPGAGKTTLAEHIIETAKLIKPAVVIARISTDDIRQELAGAGLISSGYDREANATIFDEARVRTKAVLDMGGIALIDATHLNRYREPSIEQYRDLGATTVAGLVLNVSVEVARSRNEARLAADSGYVDPADIEKMEAYRQANPVSAELPADFDSILEVMPWGTK